MNDTKSAPIGGTLAAFTIGALAGAAIALLYAPCSGKETRQMLVRRSRDLQRKANDALDEAKSTVRGKKKQFVHAMEAGRNAVRKELAKQS